MKHYTNKISLNLLSSPKVISEKTHDSYLEELAVEGLLDHRITCIFSGCISDQSEQETKTEGEIIMKQISMSSDAFNDGSSRGCLGRQMAVWI